MLCPMFSTQVHSLHLTTLNFEDIMLKSYYKHYDRIPSCLLMKSFTEPKAAK
jgi:hypothetical protein